MTAAKAAGTLQSMKLVTAAEMRVLEERAARRGISAAELMRRAGRALADQVTEVFGPIAGKNIVLMAGPGNNGGDGLLAAVDLKAKGAGVSVYLLTERAVDDAVLREVRQNGLEPIDAVRGEGLELFRNSLSGADMVIDAIFGTGSLRPIDGVIAELMEMVSREKRSRPEMMIAAVDLPSGLNADSGAIDPATLQADLTVTLANPKRGLFLYPGAAYTGDVSLADIGIPQGTDCDIMTELLTEPGVAALLPERPEDANKGTFGKVLMLGSAPQYCGASVLTCRAAGRSGAGLVTLAARRSLHSVFAAELIEVTHLLLPENSESELAPEAVSLVNERLAEYEAVVVGPGLDRDAVTSLFLNGVLAAMPAGKKAVLDADALNILAMDNEWWQKLDNNYVLTPHPGEMARLTRLTVQQVQHDRLGISRRYAELWQMTVVLKGAHTVIAAPDGRAAVSPFANPGLATAGTGDVLAGVIAALLAQGLDEFDAASTGVYIHAAAGELVRNELGECGMIASDLLGRIPGAIRSIKENCNAAGH